MKLVLNQQTLQYDPEKRKSIQIPIGRYFKPLNQSSANGMTICIGSDYKTQIMIVDFLTSLNGGDSYC